MGFNLILLFLNYDKRLSRKALDRYYGRGRGGGRSNKGGGIGTFNIGESLFNKGGRVRFKIGDTGILSLFAYLTSSTD
jgi:hypothetical protein